MTEKLLDPDRLFPADPSTRELTRGLYAGIKNLPIISPHGHTNAEWFAQNKKILVISSDFAVLNNLPRCKLV